jgi:hypothetical protein
LTKDDDGKDGEKITGDMQRSKKVDEKMLKYSRRNL